MAGIIKRIRCSPNNNKEAFALAYDDATGDAYCVRTLDGGDTWDKALIRSAAGSAKEYTVTYYGAVANASTDLSHPHKRYDDASLGPWGIAKRYGPGLSGSFKGLSFRNVAGATINAFGSSLNLYESIIKLTNNSALSGPQQVVLTGWANDYFGSGGYANGDPTAGSMPKDTARTYVGLHSGGSGGSCLCESWCIWNKVNVDAPAAFDIAPNGQYLYVGFDDAIYKSEDKGATWFALTESYGAYDICVHSQASNYIYAWTPDGELRAFLNGVSSDLLFTETPAIKQHLRIAHGKSTGYLWTATGSWLYSHVLGAWNIAAGVVDGRGLRSYPGTFIEFVDYSRLVHSNDGVTFSTKTGDLGATIFGSNTLHLFL